MLTRAAPFLSFAGGRDAGGREWTRRESDARATQSLERLDEEESDTAMMGSALAGDAARERRSCSSAPLGGPGGRVARERRSRSSDPPGGVSQAKRRERDVARVSLLEASRSLDEARERDAIARAPSRERRSRALRGEVSLSRYLSGRVSRERRQVSLEDCRLCSSELTHCHSSTSSRWK